MRTPFRAWLRWRLHWILWRAGQRRWLIAFCTILALHAVALWCMRGSEPAWLSGFSGSLVTNISTGVLFLLLGLHLNQEIELLIRDGAEREKAERDLKRFMRFLRTERYHDVRFPTLKTRLHPLGLEYTVESVRRRHVSEMETSYVVRVRSIAQERVLSAEKLAEYDDAPIAVGEYYFCRFYNRTWNMGSDTSGGGWLPFYLSGKVGPVFDAVSANDFVGASRAPEGSRLLCRFLVREDGSLMTGFGGCTPVEVLESPDGLLLLLLPNAPPKLVERRVDGNEEPLVIQDFQGYFPGEARCRFMSTLRTELAKVERQRDVLKS